MPRPSLRTSAVVLCSAAVALFAFRPGAAQQLDCSVTLAPGADVAAAVLAAAPGDTVCLRPGEHRPIALDATVAARVTLRGAGRGVTIEALDGIALELVGVDRLTVADLTLRAPDGIGVRVVGGSMLLRDLRVEETAVALLVEGGATPGLVDSTVRRALDVGIVVRGRSRFTADRLLISEAETAIAVLGDGSDAVVRASRIAGGAGPAVFVGWPGCAEPVLGSTMAPACYHERPADFAGEGAIRLDGVAIEEGAGAGIVLHPGARAELRRSQVYARALGGLFAWGASVLVSDSVFEGNGGFGVELRAFPEPGGASPVPSSGTIERTSVRFTRPLGGGLLGNGVVVRGSSLRLIDSAVTANGGNGVVVVARAAAELAATRVLENERAAMCVSDDATVAVTDSRLEGNGADAIERCA